MQGESLAITQADGTSRYYPNPGKPLLVYLPGVHGDWTLFASFRALAVAEFQIFEVRYPRTTSWSLTDYARFVQSQLATCGLETGWILAESFSSQVAWALLEVGFRPSGIILAGGFVKFPAPPLARMAAGALRSLPYQFWRSLFWLYGRYAALRHRRAPETRAAVAEFIERRTPSDLAAMRHRIDLLVANDPRRVACNAPCPIYLVAGWIDPVVFYWPVHGWLRRNCPQFRDSRLIWPADHNVLGTEPAKALAQIADWIRNAMLVENGARQDASTRQSGLSV